MYASGDFTIRVWNVRVYLTYTTGEFGSIQFETLSQGEVKSSSDKNKQSKKEN